MEFYFKLRGVHVPQAELKVEEVEIKIVLDPESLKAYYEFLKDLPEPFKSLISKAIEELLKVM